jgi:hypothetical protein
VANIGLRTIVNKCHRTYKVNHFHHHLPQSSPALNALYRPSHDDKRRKPSPIGELATEQRLQVTKHNKSTKTTPAGDLIEIRPPALSKESGTCTIIDIEQKDRDENQTRRLANNERFAHGKHENNRGALTTSTTTNDGTQRGRANPLDKDPGSFLQQTPTDV